MRPVFRPVQMPDEQPYDSNRGGDTGGGGYGVRYDFEERFVHHTPTELTIAVKKAEVLANGADILLRNVLFSHHVVITRGEGIAR